MRRRLTPSCKFSVINTIQRISLMGKEWWSCPVPLDHLLKVSDFKNKKKKNKVGNISYSFYVFLECVSISISFFRFVFADRLFLPSALVLSDCGITTSGDGTTISAFCGHVVELDLSKNQLNDWVEVR